MRKFLVSGLAITLLAAASHAGNWPQWRGPHFNGSADEKNLPVQFSETENVKWVVPMPGPSGATPAVWGDNVFVVSPNENKELLIFCLSRKDGSIKWQQKIADGNIDKGKGNSASPSPVTDGKTVWALFGTGDIAALEAETGEILWKRSLGEDYGRWAVMWIYGSSPLLYKGKLYVQVLQRTPAPADYPGVGAEGDRESYLLALDPASGKTLWKHVRPTDALMESMESYATPTPHEAGGKSQLLIVGGDVTSGHDPETGKELWRAAGINSKKGQGGGEWMRVVPSAVSAGDFAIASGPKQSPLLAYKTDGSGEVTDKALAWKLEKAPDCSTPAYWNGKLFVMDGDKKTMTCVDAKTGSVLWSGDLGIREIFRSSPTVADGKIYCIGERGNVVVLDATANECKILATNALGGPESTRASVAVSDSQLFIRTGDKLYCIGN